MKRYISTYKDYFKIRELLTGFVNCTIYEAVDSVIFYLTKKQADKIIAEGIYLYEDTPNTLLADPTAIGNGGTALYAYLGLNTAHTAGLKGNGIGVAIIDSGCDDAHAAGVLHLTRLDFTGLGANLDPSVHGSRACAMLGAVNGICPEANIYSLRSLELGSTSVIAALNWCITNKVANNIRIANISLDVGAGCDAAINATIAAGIIVICAAGNVINTYLAHPANVTGVIVAAKNSTVNPHLHDGSWQTNSGLPEVTCLFYQNGSVSNTYGSSQTAFHLSGIAAVLCQQMPSLNHEKYKRLLQRKCFQLSNYTYTYKSSTLGIKLNQETGAGFLGKVF
jgi:Subtilase family